MLKKLIEIILDAGEELFKKEEVWIILFIAGFAGIFFFLPLGIENAFMKFIELTWWFWLFLFVIKNFLSIWLFWRREIFQADTKYIVYEIRIPRETEKGPQAMEQVLASLHSLRNTADDPKEIYWDGEVTRYMSLEIISFGGEVHFYFRGYEKAKTLLEAAFFAHYPEIELVKSEDYMKHLPQTTKEIYEAGNEMWGSDMILKKDPVYPIKTYQHFLDDPGEEKRVDPMGNFLEVFGKIKQNEIAGVQILICPASADWVEPAQKIIDKFKEDTAKRQIITPEGEAKTSISIRSPGETEKLTEMENNIGKVAFNTVIRFLYIAPQEGFYDSYARRGIRGAFNQYSDAGRNGFILNEPMSTRAKLWAFPYIFPKTRVQFRKQRLLMNYFTREMPKDTFWGKLLTSHFFNQNFMMKTSILNTEAIASLFHPPTILVMTAPHLRRVESRRAGAQSGLPIFGDEEDIAKYQ
ncbi:hypothetical protein A3A21_01515 [Candidatus Jorgensenbacteria bacterium RIFCSPLOWO2_01_FULL_45_25b]|uniref:DUF8128 domain-containing protein n=1 Tax=Candidatus Jorgensenbacteria bacterium RIFCSPLOWO2_01_FULL_45_25b TaxID=1798471 RepID=A0A1F6BTJ4_9BACT|nr:MAG: hypothetical protein A3A21_01515 [Candidatus Jorgensenbacteria bacterium RIFCSPLOWO2_01_FULL_45_25b]